MVSLKITVRNLLDSRRIAKRSTARNRIMRYRVNVMGFRLLSDPESALRCDFAVIESRPITSERFERQKCARLLLRAESSPRDHRVTHHARLVTLTLRSRVHGQSALAQNTESASQSCLLE